MSQQPVQPTTTSEQSSVNGFFASLPEPVRQKIKLVLTVVLALLLLLVAVMCIQTAGYEKLSPLKVDRFK
jgi:hypothetical protein